MTPKGSAAAGLALALLLLAPAAHAGELRVSAETRRRYLAIEASGSVAAEASASDVRARVRRGSAVALEKPIEVGPGGAFRIELRTTSRLLPDEYVFEVARGPASLVTQTFRVGTVAEVASARESLRSWLMGARRTVRGFASLLERQARYHQAQLLSGRDDGGKPPAKVSQAQTRAWQLVVQDFETKFRAARMDFGLYEREVLLSPFPEAGQAIGNLFRAVDERRAVLEKAFEAATEGRLVPIEEPATILDLARRAAQDLGLTEDDSAFWKAGQLGEPESLALVNGVLRSKTGFSLEVPPGWKVVDPRGNEGDDPHQRVHLDGPDDLRVTVRVLEMPEARSWADVRGFVNVLQWEEWGGKAYKVMEKPADVPGRTTALRIHAQVVLNGALRRLLLIETSPETGRRLYELQVRVPEQVWNQRRPEVEKLAEGFKLEEPAR